MRRETTLICLTDMIVNNRAAVISQIVFIHTRIVVVHPYLKGEQILAVTHEIFNHSAKSKYITGRLIHPSRYFTTPNPSNSDEIRVVENPAI